MKVIKELFVKDMRISIFEWNQKYLVKYESGLLEQTFKIPIWDVSDLVELEIKVINNERLEALSRIFHEMALLHKGFTE